jgi:hypothetical protein
VDQQFPSAEVGTRFFRGSGTSQAAAVVSGEVALLLQRHPDMTPDQVKKAVMTTARPFPGTSVQYRGNGLTDVAAAQQKAPSGYTQSPAFFGDGSGSIEAARGSSHVADGDVELSGEQDVLGPWDAATWAAVSWSEVSIDDVSIDDVSIDDVSIDDVSIEDAAEGDTNDQGGYVLDATQQQALLDDADLAPAPEVLPPADTTSTAP